MPIEVGAEAPDFVLKDQNNQEVRLSDFRGAKNVLLVFYPLAFTGTCQGELCAVRDNLDDFVNDDVQVLTVSVDSLVRRTRSGPSGRATSSRCWPTSGRTARWPRRTASSTTERGFANRGTFIIDKAGIVRFAEMNLPGEARDQDGWRKALADAVAA